jgi:predicted Holliday junction resolvase-like endonuclease
MDENIVSVIVTCLVCFLIILFIINWFSKKIRWIERERDSKETERLKLSFLIKENELHIDSRIKAIELEVRGQSQDLATKWFTVWKEQEWETYKNKADSDALLLAKLQLDKWIDEHTTAIRKDSAKRTIAINMGRMTENLLPFSEAFKQFNPKDARFIGNPIDFVVFDGAADNRELIDIYFIEVKTGNSAVKEVQRKIARAIDDHRVYWKLIRREEFNWKAPEPDTP